MKPSILFLFFLFTILSFSQSNTEVFLFDLNTQNGTIELSNFKNVSENEGYDNQPSFMDNNTILYAGTRNGQTDIVQYNINIGSKKWISETEGGEYSPLKIPNQEAVSAIRLDVDGTQLLYRYDLKSGTNRPLIDSLVVGYHHWFDPNILFTSVLEGNSLSLYINDIVKRRHLRLQQNIGRSLHTIPNSNSMSYISKENASAWEIKSIDPITEETTTIIQTFPTIEDICWTPWGSIFMANNGILYQFHPGRDKNWTNAVVLSEYGITNITRLAISPDGTKLAVVGELANQILAPTLENIRWISGNWKGEAFGGITEENWSEPSGGSMMATFKLIDKGAVVFYEIEIIREIENSLILQLKHFDNDLKGWETKDETVDFPLKEITPNKVAFEGMTFEKIGENEMNVYVDIKQENGEVETVQFNYKK
ncbi:MAG: DUF6265 family protein [Aquaticitalea sp.]